MEIYKTLDYIYYLIFSIYNFFVRLSIPVRPKLKKMLSHNIELKRSKDYCFVIGNGPSLKNINLAELNEEDTFAVNYFYNHCPENFKSKFFVAIDQNFYKTEEKQYILQLYLIKSRHHHPQGFPALSQSLYQVQHLYNAT